MARGSGAFNEDGICWLEATANGGLLATSLIAWATAAMFAPVVDDMLLRRVILRWFANVDPPDGCRWCVGVLIGNAPGDVGLSAKPFDNRAGAES